MLIQHPDGRLVSISAERAVTLNPETVIQEGTMENGVRYRMECHYGHKVIETDWAAVDRYLSANPGSQFVTLNQMVRLS